MCLLIEGFFKYGKKQYRRLIIKEAPPKRRKTGRQKKSIS